MILYIRSMMNLVFNRVVSEPILKLAFPSPHSPSLYRMY